MAAPLALDAAVARRAWRDGGARVDAAATAAAALALLPASAYALA
jgi:hypothetical protein